MAEIEARIHRVVIEEHPDAHSLELARIGGYRTVVRKGEVQDGDLVAYIPESSILPDGLIADMGLTGKLAGRDHNRVRAERIRGVVSQGLVWPMPHRQEGDDAADELGITKHLPEIPEYMRGQVVHAPGRTVRYDIQNVKKYPDILQEGEEVVITEKIHGVQCQMGLYHGEPFVASKIYAAHGQLLIIGDVNADNIYVQAALRHMGDLQALAALPDGPGDTFQLLGEIHGPGVQDLRYDAKEKRFAAFDLHTGEPDGGRFLDHSDMERLLDRRIMCVPHFYRGPYSRERLDSLTSGKSALASHHREGVVIKTAEEREDIRLGRVILKSVSDRHLLRKGDATEFE